MNVARAREVLKDKRIEPMKTAVESFKLPDGAAGILTVEARLWYRLASQELADRVMGKGTLKIPVILMASDKKTIRR
jgi:hypothetical protein